MRGPIDYIVVGFDNNTFDGSIMRALEGAMDKGIIGLVSLAVVRKDSDGKVSMVDLEDAGDEYFARYIDDLQSVSDEISQEDIDEVSSLLKNDSAAGLLIIEHLWAKPLKRALTKAHGVLLAEGRIHPEATSV